MRVVLAIITFLVVFEVGMGRPSRRQDRSLGPLAAGRRYTHLLHPLRMLAHHGTGGAARVRRQDDCVQQCSSYFIDEKFNECANILGDIEASDPDQASTSASSFCESSSSDDLNCQQLLHDGFDCLGKYCGSDDLGPITTLLAGICKHKDDSDTYCFSTYIASERDGNTDRNSINEAYKGCYTSGSCDSDDCQKVFSYMKETLGCCYHYIANVVEGNDNISEAFVNTCGQTSLTRECSS